MALSLRIVTFLCILLVFLSSCGEGNRYPKAAFDGTRFSVDASNIREEVPVFYRASVKTKDIRFFLVMKDGEIRSYFDACQTCMSNKLGFRAEERYIVCKSCNVKYPISELSTGVGRCYPIRLQGTQGKGVYLISKEDLERGADYF